MPKANVFGAVRATTIAALCAGAGLALAGCAKEETAPAKPGTPAGAAPATEKAGGEHNCGGDHKCSPNGCGGSDKAK